MPYFIIRAAKATINNLLQSEIRMNLLSMLDLCIKIHRVKFQ